MEWSFLYLLPEGSKCGIILMICKSIRLFVIIRTFFGTPSGRIRNGNKTNSVVSKLAEVTFQLERKDDPSLCMSRALSLKSNDW